MKFGVREICDVVLRAKAAQKIGNKVFYKNEPVLYFDSLKTSTLEGAATTVYAQGGRGNARLIAWEGERTVTFTMEDALISPMGFSVLTGAGLVDATEKSIITHVTEQVQVESVNSEKVIVKLKERPYVGKANSNIDVSYIYTALPMETTSHYLDGTQLYIKNEDNTYTPIPIIMKGGYNAYAEAYPEATAFYKKSAANRLTVDDNEDYIYVMLLDDNGEIVSEPYIGSEVDIKETEDGQYLIEILVREAYDGTQNMSDLNHPRQSDLSKFTNNSIVLIDYYVERNSNAFQIDITPDKFGGNFYLEASTLFRGTNGVDMPAEFIIPNCKVQSNFTFTMAASGDPSTFTFTMDAFPDYTRWDKTKKVYAAIQVIEQGNTLADFERLSTPHGLATEYNTAQKPYIETI